MSKSIIIGVADDDEEHLEFIERWLMARFPDGSVSWVLKPDLSEFRDQLSSLRQPQPQAGATHARAGTSAEDAHILIFLDLLWRHGVSTDREAALTFIDSLRADPTTQHWPIIVYSQTHDIDEIKQCYTRRANAFLTKGDLDGKTAEARFIQVVDTWVAVQSLPTVEAGQ